MSKKYALLTFKGTYFREFFTVIEILYFKSPIDLKTASQNRPNPYALPCSSPDFFSQYLSHEIAEVQKLVPRYVLIKSLAQFWSDQ